MVDIPPALGYRSPMTLADVLVLAALQGAAEVLAVSAPAHAAAARLWLGLDRDPAALTAALQLASAAAVVVLARRVYAAALGEGVRAIARPALFGASPGARDALLILCGCASSLSASALLRPYVALWADAPLAQGLGLVITGAALASAAIAPPPGARAEAPSLLGMAVAGLAHGAGVTPGASRLGAALVILLWLGIRPGRALDLALAITAPALLVEGARGLGPTGIATDALIAGLLLAFVSASAAGAALRELAERRRIGALAIWAIPLGLATVAYARALPGVALALDPR